jgi:hypothetical protein
MRLWVVGSFLCLVLSLMLGAVANVGAAVLEVSWTAPVTSSDGSPLTDLAHYRLYVGTSTPSCPGPSFHTIASTTSAPSSNQRVSTTISGLTAGATYVVRVSAVDRSGNESGCSAAANGTADPALSVSPSGAVAFGSVAAGSSVERTFTVQNTTSSTASVSVGAPAPFSVVSGGSFSLASGASRSVVVRFQPTSGGSFAGNVTFTAQGDTVSRGVNGSGTGSSSASPRLTVSRSGNGTVTSTPSGISCGSDCTQNYAAGTQVTLSASPAAGSRFAGWSGGGCSGTGACRVTVNGAVGVTATFSPSSSGPSQPSGGGGSQPDLIVTGLSVPSSVSRNSGFTMLFNVLNQGRAPARSPQLRIYLSRDSRLSSDDVLLRARTFGAVPAGATVANAITETIPSGTGTGAYYLLLVVDAAGVVSESSESNNTLTRAVTVR